MQIKKCAIAAATLGQTNILQKLHNRPIIRNSIYNSDDGEIASAAIQNGHLCTLKWLHKYDYQLEEFWFLEESWIEGTRAVTLAIDAGHLEIVKWLVDEVGHSLFNLEDSISAVKYGDLEILKWLYAKFNDCEWKRSHDEYQFDKSVAECAARKGSNLEMVKWLHEGKCSELALESPQIAVNAALSGDLNILKWLHYNGKCTVFDQEWGVAAYAVESGNLEMVKWLHEEGCPGFSKEYLQRVATLHGHDEILQWLKKEVP